MAARRRPNPRPAETPARARPGLGPRLRGSLACLVPLLGLWSAPAATAEERTVDYTYDRLGRLTSASDGETRIDYVYDPGGNLLARTVPEPSAGVGLLAGLVGLGLLEGLLRRGSGRRARTRPRTRGPIAAGCGVALLGLAPEASHAFNGDLYDIALRWECTDGSSGYVTDTGMGPGPCEGEIHDGLPHACGTNVFTGAGIVATESQSVDAMAGTTEVRVRVESDDGSALIPTGLFCGGAAPPGGGGAADSGAALAGAPGGFAIDRLTLILGKALACAAGSCNPLAPGLVPTPFFVATAVANLYAPGGGLVLSFPLTTQGTSQSNLQHTVSLDGVHTVAIGAFELQYVVEATPPAQPGHETAAENAETKDASPPFAPLDQVAGAWENLSDVVIDPVVVGTGELLGLDELDLRLSGPTRLVFTRTYASFQGEAAARAGMHGIHDGPLGAHWSHSFHLLLRRQSATSVTLLHRKGAILDFEKNGSSWEFQATGYLGIPYQLVENGTKLELMDPTVRRVYRFEFAGTPDGGVAPVETVRDRNGNTQTLIYNPDGTLDSIADGLGRTLTFTHVTSGGTPRIAQVTGQAGRVVQYAYTGASLSEVTDARGGVTAYAYDTDEHMTSLTRPRGNVALQNAYYADGRVLSQANGEAGLHSFFYAPGLTVVTDPLGHTRAYDHDANGRVTGATDEAGESIHYTYDGFQRRLTTTDRLGDVQSITYHEPSGYVGTRTDAAGNPWTYTWTPQAQEGFTFYLLTGIDYPDGSAAMLGYDAFGDLTSFTDGEGNLTSWTRNGRGQPLTRTNAAGGVTTWTYNPDATIATREDPSGHVTTFGYDSEKRVVSVQPPGATSTTYTWDAHDNRLTVTDENGHTTTAVYDPNDNLASFTDAEGDTTTYVYDANDEPIQVTDPSGEVTSYAYDGLRRLVTATDARGNPTTLTYDARRRVSEVVDEAGETWSFTYDLEGVPTSLTDPEGQTWLTETDELGRLTRVEDPLGHITGYAWDELGRLVRRTDPLGRNETIDRDDTGRVTALHLDLPGHTASYARNALLQIEAITDLRGETWSRPRDAQGRLVSQTDPLGNLETYAYDPRSRVDQITLPGGLGSVDFSYDEGDRLVRTDYSDGTSFTRSYDDDDLLVATTGVSLVRDPRGLISDSNGLAMTYDENGNLATLTYAPGKTVTYAYDARNLLTTVTDWAGGVTTLHRDVDGKLVAVGHANGTRTDYGYDTADRLVAIDETADAGATFLASLSLTRDADGQILQAVRDLPLQPGAGPAAIAASYDAASQEAAASYDAMGRLTDDGRSFVWNLAGQLLSFTEVGNTVTFTRDAFGNVLTRTEGGVTRGAIWNYGLGLPSLATETLGGAPLRHHVYTPGGLLLYSLEAADDARRVYHYDEMGSTVFVTDGAGTIVQRYAYAPYGELLAESGGLDNAFTWHGRYGVTREGSLYSMRARYYDPAKARFASRDPRQQLDARSSNPYQALFDNPLLYVDPRGTDGEKTGQAGSQDQKTKGPFRCRITFFHSDCDCVEKETRRRKKHDEDIDSVRNLRYQAEARAKETEERSASGDDEKLRAEDKLRREERERRDAGEVSPRTDLEHAAKWCFSLANLEERLEELRKKREEKRREARREFHEKAFERLEDLDPRPATPESSRRSNTDTEHGKLSLEPGPPMQPGPLLPAPWHDPKPL